MTTLRQKVLMLYTHNSDLAGAVVAWSLYDGTGKESHTSGNSEKPPYPSVIAAMQEGWRVVQFPRHLPAYPGMEYNTSYLKFEFILEKMEEPDGG